MDSTQGWLVVLGLTISVFEILKHPETGFDLVLLGLTVALLGLGWGLYGLSREGMATGLIVFTLVKTGVKFKSRLRF